MEPAKFALREAEEQGSRQRVLERQQHALRKGRKNGNARRRTALEEGCAKSASG